MNKMIQRTGFAQTLVAASLVALISVVTYVKKDLFVQETGQIQIFGGAGLLLAIGMLLRWRYVRLILGISVLISLFGVTLMTLATPSTGLMGAHIVLILTLALIAYLSLFSRAVKTYMGS